MMTIPESTSAEAFNQYLSGRLIAASNGWKNLLVRILELWFDNIDGFNAFANSPSYLNVIKQDEERFTDPKKCEYFFSEERTIIK
jgi:hypothetical protein